MTSHELQPADLARVRAELAAALAAKQADAALEALIGRIDARLAQAEPQPSAAVRARYGSAPALLLAGAPAGSRAHVPRGFFAG